MPLLRLSRALRSTRVGVNLGPCAPPPTAALTGTLERAPLIRRTPTSPPPSPPPRGTRCCPTCEDWPSRETLLPPATPPAIDRCHSDAQRGKTATAAYDTEASVRVTPTATTRDAAPSACSAMQACSTPVHAQRTLSSTLSARGIAPFRWTTPASRSPPGDCCKCRW